MLKEGDVFDCVSAFAFENWLVLQEKNNIILL